MESLLGLAFSPEELVGRNFARFINGALDVSLALEVDCVDLPLELPDEAGTGDDGGDELRRAILPPVCWVKRLSAVEAGENGFFLLVLTLEDGRVAGVQLLRENICGSNRSWISFPGTDTIAVSSYEVMDDVPDIVAREIEALRRRRFLPLHFALEGKPFPAALAENGDDSFVCPSAFRQACMHMDVDSEDGVIVSLGYATYPFAGDAWGDMCSRPRCLLDLYEESVDMLLWLVDRYSEEEYQAFLAMCEEDFAF